jgi:hypothetical protein
MFISITATCPELRTHKFEVHVFRGVDKFFKALASLASSSAFLLTKSKKQQAKNIERDIEREKNSNLQSGEWGCIFIRQS